MLKTVSAHPARGHVLCYEFAMRRPDAKQTIGIIHLRFGYRAKLRYTGHIGYEVEPEISRAPLRRPQVSLANAHSLRKVWLTVELKDIPSQKNMRDSRRQTPTNSTHSTKP